MSKCYWKKPAWKVIGLNKASKEKKLKKRSFSVDPDREKLYGSTYTERQNRILSGDLPWEIVPTREISLLINKTKQLGDMELYEKAVTLRELKKSQGTYIPQMTPEEAKEILKNLNPDHR